MSMIKRAKSGKIKEVVDNRTKKVEAIEEIDPNYTWGSVVIRDVLDVPSGYESIDVDLDDDDGDDIIAVRV